jgi:ABC-type glycerol-3-phosphate transport system permease component
MVDGKSRLGAVFKITIPIAMPGIVTSLIFTFIAAWNEFIAALTLTANPSQYPLTVRLDSFRARIRSTGSTCSASPWSPPSRCSSFSLSLRGVLSEV